MKAVATDSVTTMKITGLVLFGASQVFETALDPLMRMISLIQIVMHIPLMNIDVPPNAVSFYKITIPVVNYDMLGDVDLYEDSLIDISRSSPKAKTAGRKL